MRSVRYEDWKKKRRDGLLTAVDVENAFDGPSAGRRPRDPEKERLLIELEIARRNRFIKSGKLQILGPRLWKWRIDFKKSTEN